MHPHYLKSVLILAFISSNAAIYNKKSATSHLNKATHLVPKRPSKGVDGSIQRRPSQYEGTIDDKKDVNYSSLERKLQLHILRESHPNVRPVLEKDCPVNVTFGFSLVQIVSLDEHKQSITMKIWLRMKWTNQFLTWDPHEWGNITTTRVRPHEVWTPDIFLEEDVGEEVTAGLAAQKISLLVNQMGFQEWMVPVMLHSACEVDVTMFPFDIQHCKLVFTPWTHNQHELDLLIEKKDVLTKHYVESSEWTFLNVTKKAKSMKYICCPTPFVNIEYVFTLQRKPLYYIHNLVIPCVLQMIIILSTFFLPLECGERIGVVITIILVFAVYLQVLRESLPESSSSTPLLSKFFIIIMGESACLLIATCCILKVHFKGMQRGVGPVPGWAKTLFLEYIAKLVCIGPLKEEVAGQKEKKYDVSNIIHVIHDSGFLASEDDDSLLTPSPVKSYVYHDDRDCLLRRRESPYQYESLHNFKNEIVSKSQEPLVSEVRHIRNMIEESSGRCDIEDEWCRLAKVLDRLCFFIFLFAFSASSFVMLLPAYLLVY